MEHKINFQKAKALPLDDRNVNTNPDDISLWALIAEDYRTTETFIMSRGFFVLLSHRFGNWRFDVKNRFLRLPLNILYRLMFELSGFFCQIHLPCDVPIGRRLNLLHHGGMFFGARRIGNDVILKQNTTLGFKDGYDPNALPTIGDHVEIGAGAVVLGNITIGHHSFVAANSLVLKNVPPHSIAMGVPARIFKKLDE